MTTGWSERAAVLGRGQAAMEAGFERIVARVPFPIRELHPDNGSEFFNYHLVRFWKDKVTGVHLSRSRPYQKNDNRMVEQKNNTLVRQYLGQLRLDTPEQVAALDALYEQMWLYYNLFQPVLHLCEKTMVGDKVVRKWDEAKTPYERRLSKGVLSESRSKHGCSSSMSRPIRSSCAKLSIANWPPCGRRPPPSLGVRREGRVMRLTGGAPPVCRITLP